MGQTASLQAICRKQNSATYSLTASSTTTDAIPFDEFAAGGYLVTALATGVTVNYYGCDSQNGTYLPIYDSAATPAAKTQAVAASRAFAIPAEALPFPFLKFVLDAGTATITFCRKG